MKTVRLIGSNILFDLAHNDCSKDFKVLDSILWHSPFAMVNLGNEFGKLDKNTELGTGEESTVLSLELKKNLDELIDSNPTEYIVLESMGACWYNLLERGNSIYTKNRFVENSDWYRSHKEEFKIINLKTNSEFNWKKYFDEYIRIIKKYYSSEKIIYIRSHFSGYCKVECFLKDEMLSPKSNQLLKQIDDYFIEATQCKEINIGKNFFSDEKSKYGKNICFYENEYYSTLVENINYAIVDTSRKRLFNEIKYSIRLKRYIECYESIIFNNLSHCYWKMEEWLDELTFNLGYKALIKFKDLLLTLADNNAKCISDIDCIANYPRANELCELAYIIDAIKEKNYVESLNWKLAFQYEIETLKKLNNDLRNLLVQRKINVGDVDFALEKNFELIKCFFEGKISEDILPIVLERKQKIDIWGSCVTREIFNYNRTKWGIVGKYVCRNCLLFSFDESVDDIGLGIDFSNLSDFGNNAWRRRVVWSSLKRYNVQWLKESNSEWLIVDLYDVAKRNIFKYKNQYFCLGGRWLSYDFWGKISDKVERVNIFEFDEEYLKEQFDKFILFCKERYGNKVILCNVTWHDFYLNSQSTMKQISGVKQDYDKNNAFVKKWECYIKDNMDCYYIDISKWFYADELNPYILNGVHYEMAYYDEMARILKEIILCMPERRVYNECSARCIVKRAIRLKGGMDWEMYLKCLHQNTNIVLRIIYLLNESLIRKYLNVFEHMYRNDYDSINSCLEMFNFELWNAEELKTIIQEYV